MTKTSTYILSPAPWLWNLNTAWELTLRKSKLSLMKPFLPFLRQGAARLLGLALLASMPTPPSFGAGVTVRLAAEPDSGEGGRWTRSVAEEWARETGNKLEYISRPNDASAAVQQYQQYWAARSPDIDVYLVDVIWQGIVGPHAVDLKKYLQRGRDRGLLPAHHPEQYGRRQACFNTPLYRRRTSLLSHRSAGKVWL